MILYPTRLEMLETLVPKGHSICEIGVFRGAFSQQIRDTLKPKRLILIDPFDGRMISGDADGNNVEAADLPLIYVKMVDGLLGDPAVMILRGRSEEMLPRLRGDSLDCVYIDGDHSYEGVKQDLEMAWRIVRPGGYLCGHDYETNLEKTNNVYDFGVKRAVDEFCEAKGVKILAKGMDGQVSFCIQKPTDSLKKD